MFSYFTVYTGKADIFRVKERKKVYWETKKIYERKMKNYLYIYYVGAEEV